MYVFTVNIYIIVHEASLVLQVELIVLNVGLQTGILSVRSFSVMVIMCIFTTILACPLVQCIYPPSVRTYIEAKITRVGQGGHGVDSIDLGLEGETGLWEHPGGEDSKVGERVGAILS